MFYMIRRKMKNAHSPLEEYFGRRQNGVFWTFYKSVEYARLFSTKEVALESLHQFISQREDPSANGPWFKNFEYWIEYYTGTRFQLQPNITRVHMSVGPQIK